MRALEHSMTWGGRGAILPLAAAGAVLAPAPALTYDIKPDHNIITETIASRELSEDWDKAASLGANTVQGRVRGPGEPEGLRYGNFKFNPSAEIRATYDDNIYSSPDPIADLRTELRPSLMVSSDLPRHFLGLGISARLVSFAEHSDNNYADANASLTSAFHLDHAHTLSIVALSELTHDERDETLTPNDAAVPIPRFHNRAAIGLTRDAGRLFGTVSVSADTFDFSDVESVNGGTIDQDSRDFELYTAQLRAGYRFSPGYAVIGKVKGIRQLNEGSDHYSSQSTGYEVTAGLQLESSPLLRWHLMGGWGVRDYDRADQDTYSGAVVEGGFQWLPTERLTINGKVQHGFADEGTGLTTTSLRADLAYDIFNNIVGRAGAYVTEKDFADASRTDQEWGANIGLDYHHTKNWVFTLDYDYTQRDSTLDGEDYERNRVMVGARMRF